jgi:hypothetical protein
MKIVLIFEDQLFAFHYEDEAQNELARLLNQWTDMAYLHQFVTENKGDTPKDTSVLTLVNQIIENTNDIDDNLNEISKGRLKNLGEFFKPLYNHEYRAVELSKQKGRKNYLRLYAIRIDENCFVITGGAIKFHHLNKDRPHTQKEMQKLDKCRDYLKGNDVFDADSFYEFLMEEI